MAVRCRTMANIRLRFSRGFVQHAGVSFNPLKLMRDVIVHLHYVPVLVVAVVGFLLGWLWYSPVLFVKPWMAEMKFTEAQMADCKQRGMAAPMIKGFIMILVSTFGLAVLIAAHGAPNWKHSAALGMFIGAVGPVARMLAGAGWEGKSCKLQAITAGHEIVLYTLQGAILGGWR
jgi:hypothetical protein